MSASVNRVTGVLPTTESETQRDVARPNGKPVCRHCGAALIDPRMRDTGFCCAGCNYVFRLVHEHGLASYYQIKDDVTAGNASLSYSHRGFGVRVLGNYTGDYLGTFAEAPARRVYRRSRTILNLGLSYQWRPAVSLFLDLSNLTNEPQQTYRYIPSQVERSIYTGTTITFGVSGRF